MNKIIERANISLVVQILVMIARFFEICLANKSILACFFVDLFHCYSIFIRGILAVFYSDAE